MLVISRRKSEKTIVRIPPSTEPQEVVIQIIRPGGGGLVRLGFEAPRSISIVREEIAETGRAA